MSKSYSNWYFQSVFDIYTDRTRQGSLVGSRPFLIKLIVEPMIQFIILQDLECPKALQYILCQAEEKDD